MHYGFDEHRNPVWRGVVPELYCQNVIDASFRLASYVATQGVGEKRIAKGFLLILGEREQLLSGNLGTLPSVNKFQHINIHVAEVFLQDFDAYFREVLESFLADKAWLAVTFKHSGFVSTCAYNLPMYKIRRRLRRVIAALHTFLQNMRQYLRWER